MPLSNRIIRGEQAQQFQTWSVDNMGAAHANRVERLMSEVGALKPAAAQPVVKPLSDDELRLMAWEEQLQQREARIAELEQQALHDAEQAGKQRGYEAGWDAAHHERVALIQAANSLTAEFEQFKTQLSEKLLDLAVLVAKKVVGDTIQLHPETAAAALQDILLSMNLDAQGLTLLAHPTTLQALEAQFGDQQELAGLKMVADSNQLQGGFVLRHPEGEVDASLQSRWLRAIEALNRHNEIKPDDLNSSSSSENPEEE